MLSGWNFSDALAGAVRTQKSPLCCGLDPQLKFMPPHMVKRAVEVYGPTSRALCELYVGFNHRVIDAVRDIVACVKPQRAFYEAYGPEGDEAFCRTVGYAHQVGLLVVEDAKRGDGGDTADAYADGHIGQVPFFGEKNSLVLTRVVSPTRADCLTVTPYIGADCVGRFVERVKQFGTGVFVVTKTSFKPNSAVEQIGTSESPDWKVWQEVARLVEMWGEGTEGACGLRNVGVVMGATFPDDAPEMRRILPNAWFLIPGYGAQGGGAKGAVVGIRPDGLGGVVNSSRGLTYAYLDKDGKLKCESEKCFDLVRQEAIRSRDELVAACRDAGKWPF